LLILSADRRELALAISGASQGLAGRPGQPVYAGMLLSSRQDRESIELAASDGEITFVAQAPAQVHAQGSVLLPGRMLAEISKYFTGDTIGLEHQGSTAKIMAGRSTFVLSAASGEDYPKWPDAPASLGTMEGAEFAAAARKVIPVAGKTIPGIADGAVCLTPDDGRLFMACTDGASMAVMSPAWDGADGVPALVPVPAMERFTRMVEDGTVSLGWEENLITMETPGLRVVTRKVTGRFRKWREILDAAPEKWVTADTPELIRLVKVAQLAAADDKVELAFDRNDLLVRAAGQQGQTEGYTETDYGGPGVSFFFGGAKLLDGLSACGKTVQLAWGRAMFLRSGEYSFMIQPRRDMTIGEGA